MKIIMIDGEEYRQPETFEEMMSPENIAYHKQRHEKWIEDHKNEPCECKDRTIGECSKDCVY